MGRRGQKKPAGFLRPATEDRNRNGPSDHRSLGEAGRGAVRRDVQIAGYDARRSGVVNDCNEVRENAAGDL